MDTTEQYRKMCEKLPDEVVKKLPIIEKGVVICSITPDVVMTSTGNYWVLGIKDGERVLETVLLRQDQIQMMVGRRLNDLPIHNIGQFNYIIHGVRHSKSHPENNYDYYVQFKTYEQLWLAFMLRENHNVIWDFGDEEWVGE